METNPFLDLTASILVHTALKGSIVLLVVFAISHWLRSPIQRHFSWCLTFVFLLILPVAVLSIPSYQPRLPASATQLIPRELTAPTPAVLATHNTTSEKGLSVTLKTPPSTQTENQTIPLKYWLIFFWMLGACAGAFYYLVQYTHIIRLLHRATSVKEENWTLDLHTLKEKLRIQRNIHLVCSEEVDIPVVFGIWRPTIALPLDALTWPPEKRHQVLMGAVPKCDV